MVLVASVVTVGCATEVQVGGNTSYRDPPARAWQYGGTDYTFSGWQAATGIAFTDQAVSGVPTATRVFVRPNTYELGRATVVVYNWGGQRAVSVDLSGGLGVGQPGPPSTSSIVTPVP